MARTVKALVALAFLAQGSEALSQLETTQRADDPARDEMQAAKQESRDETLHKQKESRVRMAAAEQRIQAAMRAKDEDDTRLQKVDEGIAKLKAVRQELAEAQAVAVQELHDAELAAKEANADARNELQAAKQDSRDGTLHKSKSGHGDGSGSGQYGGGSGSGQYGGGSGSGQYGGGSGSGQSRGSGSGQYVGSGSGQYGGSGSGDGSGSGCEGPTQSCEVWADPHVSGFDNADNQGPESLALIAFKSATDSRARFTYGGSGSGDIASAFGVSTFDKRPVDLNAYDTGDFWLVKSDPVHIQGRFRLSGEFIPDKAAIGAVAIGGPFMHGHKLVVEPLDGTIYFDGKVAPVGSWSRKTEDGQEEIVSLMDDGRGSILAELPMGISLFFRRLDKHVDIKITMPEIDGGIDGECGNYDGIAENDVEKDIQDRMGGLKVDGPQILFDKPFDQSVLIDVEF